MRIASGLQLGDERLRLLRWDREEKATGGLGIEEEGSQGWFDCDGFFDDAIGEVAVGEEAARDAAEAHGFHRAIQQVNGRGVNAEAYIAAEGQLAGVAHKAEAGDVSGGMHLELGAADDFAGDLVEVVIDAMAASIHAGCALPCLRAVVMTPVPMALVKMSASPGRAVVFLNTRSG